MASMKLVLKYKVDYCHNGNLGIIETESGDLLLPKHKLQQQYPRDSWLATTANIVNNLKAHHKISSQARPGHND